ncbi:glycoside hydrolase family 2 protein [Candidatus Latescibacterota bacterium]
MTGLVNTRKILYFIVLCFTISVISVSAAPGRWEKEISGDGWKLWLDHAAEWSNDDIYLPPVDVSSLPVNPPTCGWDKLDAECERIVTVPGTVEEYFWGEIGGVEPDVGGDYRGVSWWSTTFSLDPDLKGKKIVICFESVNLRAEIFVNKKLVGYDVIGNTQFEADATGAVVFGAENRIDVRITDPVGNFSWNDNILMRWGKNLIPAVHGFGGITGKVVVKAADAVHVDDIYVQNKPDPKKAEVFVTIGNSSGTAQKGEMSLVIHEWQKPSKIVWQKSVSVTVPPEGQEISLKVNAPKAKLWELAGHRTFKAANLYEASVVITFDGGKINDSASQRFGFRFFDVGVKNGDKRFYLNGKRVFIFAAMTRGFWPKNGIFATPEMAKRDMESLVDLGYNMMLLHRAIGQPPVIDYADRMGLLTYEEPGGYMLLDNRQDNIDGPDQQAYELRREKLRRMVIRDRSLPSMIIYNLINEARKAPEPDDEVNMRMVHTLDPSRIVTYNSDRNRTIDYSERLNPDPFKLHMLPFDDTFYYHGWWDQHHWYAYAGYADLNYNNPRYYLRGVVDAPTAPVPADSLNRLQEDEIIFWGEEGAFGTMVRLEKIKEELEITGATGFRELEHIDWFNSYDRFLDDSGFRRSYPTVDDLTMSLGRNMHYFHGRNIENVRMSNIADGYNLNGWGSGSTRTDIVDMYRNPTSDPSILQYYTQPLYVAVKIRDKVLPVGSVPVADFWIINETNLRGKNTLEISLDNPAGETVFTKEFTVNISGGEEFGQLLVEDVKIPAVNDIGHYMLNARITNGGVEKATGYDDIFAIDYMSGRLSGRISVLDSDSTVKDFLKTARGVSVSYYNPNISEQDYIVVGAHDIAKDSEEGGKIYDDILKRVVGGTNLIVLSHADLWAEQLNRISHSKPPTYEGGGIVRFRNSGRYFVGDSKYLAGLPDSQSMSWEHQFFYTTGNVSGLRLHNYGTELIVALGGQGTKDILSGLSRIQLGSGQIFLSTMDFLPGLASEKPQASAAKKLFLNMLEISE